jgi:hypothetical protein
MNNFQKAGVFVIRVVAAFLVLMGTMELARGAWELAYPRQMPPGFGGLPVAGILISNAIKAGVGLFLWLFALPLGRLFGKDLG